MEIFTDTSKWFSIFPSGIYRGQINVTSSDSVLLYIDLYNEVKSEIKTSF